MRQDIETRHNHEVEAAVWEEIHSILVERFFRWVVVGVDGVG